MQKSKIINITKTTEEFRRLGIWTDEPSISFWTSGPTSIATPAQVFGEIAKALAPVHPAVPETMLDIFKNLKHIGFTPKSLIDMISILGVYFKSDSIELPHFLADLQHVSKISKDEPEFDQRWRRLNAARGLRLQALSTDRNILLTIGRRRIEID